MAPVVNQQWLFPQWWFDIPRKDHCFSLCGWLLTLARMPFAWHSTTKDKSLWSPIMIFTNESTIIRYLSSCWHKEISILVKVAILSWKKLESNCQLLPCESLLVIFYYLWNMTLLIAWSWGLSGRWHSSFPRKAFEKSHECCYFCSFIGQ